MHKRLRSLSLVYLVAIATFGLSLLGLPGRSAPTPAAATVPGHFGFGLQAGADLTGINGWMPNSGVPWDYAYRYIGGGLNRPNSPNWTASPPNATFPISYAQAARAKGYTPVLSYYTLQAAVGPCSGASPACPEAQSDLSNLNSPNVMSLFYNDFALLMKRLGTGTYDGVAGYGQDVIVHVEPDLSGYAESAVLSSAKCYGFCTGIGNNPSLLKASVASSGVKEVTRFSNTYRGFNQALLHLRDLYAPNARLAFHVSGWATLYDINTARATTLNGTTLGTKAGQFAAASGTSWTDGTTSTYDLVFNDVSNKDAGQYTYQYGNYRFWDRNNAVFPNFHRWEDYVRGVTAAAGRKAIAWQVPMGNQYFQTENNSPGHYQDNRAEYFFAHVGELRDAGLVGVLFGGTNPDATRYYDAQKDAVTNSDPICTTDGVSDGATICNNHAAIGPDDDGGYLRVTAGQYYAAPVSLP
jgi:hypothetical protein